MKKLMKNLVGIGMLLSLSFNVASCGETSSSSSLSFTNSEPINVIKNSLVASFIVLDEQGLQTKISQSESSYKDDFVLFIYQSGCQGCYKDKSYFAQLAEEEHYLIYGIPYSSYNRLYQQNGSPNYIAVTGTPTILFYSSGKPVGRLIGAPKNYSTFKQEVSKMLKPMNLYCLNTFSNKTGSDGQNDYKYSSIDLKDTSYLDSFIKDNPKAIVCFSWQSCVDCLSLYNEFLIEYASDNPDIKICYFEVEGFRASEGDTLNPDWAPFASKYGLDNYLNGKVPSFITYQDGAFNSMVVYHNEGEASKNDDSTYSYKDAYNPEVKDLKEKDEESLAASAQKKELDLIRALYN